MNRMLKLAAGVLPVVIFFAVFAAAGDVLIATTAAVLGAIAQVILIWSANRKAGALMWISLALVLGLGGATLAGTTVYTPDLSPTPVNCTQVHCVCHMPVQPI